MASTTRSSVLTRHAPRQIRRHFRWNRQGWCYGFALPAACAISRWFGYPLVRVVRFSSQSGSVGDLTDVGFVNYAWLWEDPVFIRAALTNLGLLVSVPIMTLLALIVALILNGQVAGWRQHRVIVFLPYILPATGHRSGLQLST